MRLSEDKERPLGELPPEFETLYVENGLLRAELATLMEEAEYLTRVAIPHTQTSHTIKIGALRAESMQLQINVMKVRRRLVLVRDSLQKGERSDSVAITGKIEQEFHEWEERLRVELANLEDAKARFSSLTPSEDEAEVRSLYRILSRKMNPEINPEQSEEARSFWPGIHSAYVSGDLFHLKALLMMADDYPESYDLPSDIGAVRKAGERLRKRISFMHTRLADIRNHPAFEWRKLLGDPQRLSQEQARLREEIEKSRLQLVALQDMLRSLEMKSSIN